VDRIGAGTDRHRSGAPRLRLLGQYATVVVESGAGTLVTQHLGTHRVQPGDVILLTPDEPAVYHPDTEWYSRWVVWNGPEAAALQRLGYLPTGKPLLRGCGNAVNQAYFALVKTMASEDLAAVLQRKLVVLQLLLDLFQAHRQNAAARSAERLGEQVIEFVTRNYTQNLSIPELARTFHLSPTHFRRLFRAYSGRSPREFVNAMRVSRAKELLSQGIGIKQTAMEVGFEDVFYFMRVFRRMTGTPPGRFAAGKGL
jgi:AraC-like DNA-binding protein